MFTPVSRVPQHFNPTTVTNTRLGKDPPIPSLNFERPPSEPRSAEASKINLSFDDMSDEDDGDEGLTQPLLDNIFSVLSDNEDTENQSDVPETRTTSDNKENENKGASSKFDLPTFPSLPPTRHKPLSPDNRITNDFSTPIAPLRIPKSRLSSMFKTPNPADFETPPLKIKISRTNDGSWTTGEKKRKKKREKDRGEKGESASLISFLKFDSPSPSLIIKRACVSEEKSYPSVKLKINKTRLVNKFQQIKELKIKPLPPKSPVRRVSPIKITTDTHRTARILDKIPRKSPERATKDVRTEPGEELIGEPSIAPPVFNQRRLSEESDSDSDICETAVVTVPPSPPQVMGSASEEEEEDVVEVEPPPKPVPVLIDLDDNIEDTEETEIDNLEKPRDNLPEPPLADAAEPAAKLSSCQYMQNSLTA